MGQIQSQAVAIAGTDGDFEHFVDSNLLKVKGLGENRFGRHRLLQAMLFIAIWTVVGIAGSVHCYFSYAALGEPLSWPRAFALGMSLWYAWGVLSVVIFQWTRLWPLDANTWLQRLPVHLCAGIIFALAKLIMDYPIIKFIYCLHPERCDFPTFFRMAFIGYFFRYLVISWLLMGVAHALWYFQKYRERESRAKRLETRLTQARLQMLHMQLHPHFLMNALNTIASLMHSDVDRADEALCKLADLLRFLLERAGIQEVSVREELEFIESYLEIERLRFGARVGVRIQVDHHLWQARVPHLLLQPLVENALRHGINGRADPGHIDIRVCQRGDRLRLEVLDDGPGLSWDRSPTTHGGVGLSNTRARLQELYPNSHHFAIYNRPSGGTVAAVELPLRQGPADSTYLEEPAHSALEPQEAV
jgi:hypothetical protein